MFEINSNYIYLIIEGDYFAGCGKTTVGSLVAQELSLPFYDADDFHSQENKAKMGSGTSLTDEDRYPWLNTLSNLLASQDCILACSALKKSYR